MEWNQDLTKIADFAAERGIDRNLVTQYIRRHAGDFEGHTVNHDNAIYGDYDAIKKLDKKYPLPRPVEIIHDPEADALRKEVIILQKQLIEAKSKEISLLEKAALVESQQKLLEDREVRLKEQNDKLEEITKKYFSAQKDCEKSERELENAKSQAEQEKERRISAEEKLEEIRKMGFFKRIFWKG